MRGERDRKKPQSLEVEHDEQNSRGQWNTAENGFAPMKTATRVGNSSIMGCLPRTATLISAYPIAPFSPGRDIKRPADKRPADYGARWRMANCHARGYSGPLISIIPKEARGEKKGSGFDSQEPTSPKVSCIGQVKKKKCMAKTAKAKAKAETNKDQSEDRPGLRTKEPKTLKLKKFFSISHHKKPERPVSDAEPTEEAVAPSLGQLKRFSSGRNQGDLLANIFQNSQRGDSRCSPTNYTAEDSSDEDSGDVKRSVFDDREVENPKNEGRKKQNSLVLISHSGPLLSQPLPKPAATCNGQPTEINLWKRRAVPPPMALDLERSYGLEMRQPSTA